MDEEGATTVKGATLRAFSGVKAHAVCNSRRCLPGGGGLDGDDNEGDEDDAVNKDAGAEEADDEEDDDEEDDEDEEPARAGGADGRKGE